MRLPDLETSLAGLIMALEVPIGTDVPGIFLKQKDVLTSILAPERQVRTTISRQADEKIGQTDCFVISVVTDLEVPDKKSPPGQMRDIRSTTRLSIGKQDFLIRRMRNEDPGLGKMMMTITHGEDLVNPHLSPDDFAH